MMMVIENSADSFDSNGMATTPLIRNSMRKIPDAGNLS